MTLGVLVAVSWGSGDLFAAVAARTFGAFRTLAIAQLTELTLCVAAWAMLRPSLVGDAGALGMLLCAGVLTAGAYGALYRGLALGPISLVGPIGSAYAVGPTILAVLLLGEHLPTDGAIGAAAAIVGVGLVTASHAGAPERSAVGSKSGVPYGFAAMFGFAMSAFLIAAFAQRLGWLPPLLLSRIGVAVTLAGAVRFAPGMVSVGAPGRRARGPAICAAIAGSCNLVGTAAYAYAGELQLIAVASPVSALFPLVPVAGGVLLFRERLGLIGIAGIGAIIVGLFLLG